MMDTIIKILERYGTVYMQGLAGTLWLAAITVVLGTAVGTLLAVLRLSRVRVFNGSSRPMCGSCGVLPFCCSCISSGSFCPR